jgi:hypothetical protein
MTIRMSLIGVTGLFVIFGLPLAGYWARLGPHDSCALDGSRLEPRYQVHIVDHRGRDQWFCCIHCATLWLGQQEERPRSILVTDEATGAEIDAAAAWFVRSIVITMPHTGNDIHTFRHLEDAERHASQNHGSVLSPEESPFFDSAIEQQERSSSSSPPGR